MKKFDKIMKKFGYEETKENFKVEELFSMLDLERHSNFKDLKDGFCYTFDGERKLKENKILNKIKKSRKLDGKN